VIRIAMACLGAVLLAVLGAAVHQDPHLWGALLTQLDHQARSHGTRLDGQVQRLVTPRSTP
jgi:hypothetical protein